MAQADIHLVVQLFRERVGILWTVVGSDMLRLSGKSLKFIHVCMRNICSCSGCFGCKVVQYNSKCISDNNNCVKAFSLLQFCKNLYRNRYKRSFSYCHWYQLYLPTMPICLAVLSLDASYYIAYRYLELAIAYENT